MRKCPRRLDHHGHHRRRQGETRATSGTSQHLIPLDETADAGDSRRRHLRGQHNDHEIRQLLLRHGRHGESGVRRHPDQRAPLLASGTGRRAAKVVEYAKWMDERGYDTFWMAEHHCQPEGTELISNLLMMAMHLCGVTKNLRIGCGFNVVPMWHPLRLAEDYAMADILTGGRVIFGVARGYHTREVETFGAPLRDQKANRELFEEGVDILFKAFE